MPPERFFGKAVKQRYNLDLDWLYTHEGCNSSSQQDEAYFVAVMVILARESEAGQAVYQDYARGIAKGHSRNLAKRVIGQFGRVALDDRRVALHWEEQRIAKVVWKLVRGLHFIHTAVPLPELWTVNIDVFVPSDAHNLEQHPWYAAVRDTQSFGKYPGVLDVKAIGLPDRDCRAHAYALLIWDRITVLALFHDPSCPCADCAVAVKESVGNP